jgi:hypothetical protein
MAALLVSRPATMMLSRRSVRSSGKSMGLSGIIIRRTLFGKLHFCAVIQPVDTIVHYGLHHFEAGKDGGLLAVNRSRFNHPN